MQSIINSLSKQGKEAPLIAEVWSLDTYNSGDAATLNRGKIGHTISWLDHPRDIAQFLDFYLPEEGEEVQTVLEEHEKGTTRDGRTVIGVGHSFSEAVRICLLAI